MPSRSSQPSSSSNCSNDPRLPHHQRELQRKEKLERAYEPIRHLIELREAVESDIAELRDRHPKPGKQIQQRIEQLIELRNQLQGEINLLCDHTALQKRND